MSQGLGQRDARVVVVTGCSSGIGLSTALAFAARGDRVYATMRAPERAGALLQAAADRGIEVEVLALDVADDGSVRSAIDHVVGVHGRVDVVVNNAGIAPFGPIERSTDHEWRSTFETNVLGPVRVARAALPAMRAAGSGVIVTISSIAGRLAPLPTQGAYASSKHAVCVLTDSINAECAAFGVRAVCIEPGFFSTAIMDADTIPQLAADDPYRPVMDGIEAFFRASMAAAPPPDAVSDLVLAAADGTLSGGPHHTIGVEGIGPRTTTGER